MLQYCVLYAKIQKLNMSNRMNKTNSDNEVYKETDLRAGPVSDSKLCQVQPFNTDVPFWPEQLQII